jgi:hypothetical protein
LVPRRHPGCDSHVGEGAIYEIAHPDQTAVQYCARRPGEPYIASFDGGNGESRGVDEVTQLVYKKAQPFIERLKASICKSGIPCSSSASVAVGAGR